MSARSVKTRRSPSRHCRDAGVFGHTTTALHDMNTHTPTRIGSRSLYGKAPMRQLHSNPIAVPGSGHTGEQINLFDAVIHMQESPPQMRFLVGCSSPLYDSPNTSRHFALSASDICLVGEHPTCSVSALWGCESLWRYDFDHV